MHFETMVSKSRGMRGLDRRNILALAQGDWLTAHEHLLKPEQQGNGTTRLGCAFGHQAARLDR